MSNRRWGGARRVAIRVAGATLLTVVGWQAPGAAWADPPVPVSNGSFGVHGAGFGHGIGMSQYGAYGQALGGRTWPQILSFSYPGTSLGSRSRSEQIQVWLQGDDDRDLRVLPAAGLRVGDEVGHSYLLPTGSRYREWRAVRSVTGIFKLQYLDAGGHWVTKSHPLSASAARSWRFTNTAKLVSVRLTDRSRREVRGSVAVFFYAGGTRTVNRLWVENYLRSVVPSEMPTSWHPQAVAAQAVAARTYAARLRATPIDPRWDICDSVSCQVYRGYATTTVAGVRTVHETTAGDTAVLATAGRVVTYGGAPALTQFHSSDGGHTAPGGYPYLLAQPDPYDAVVRPNTWAVSLSATTIQHAYPTVGPVRQLQVLTRDTFGPFGGRVLTLAVTGDGGTVTVSGPDFRFATGLRSALFTIDPVTPPATPAAGGTRR